jgi:hypothetical protein
MWEPLIPKEVSDWMNRKAWGIHHNLWHFERRWELDPGMNQYVLDHGGQRADRQEGMRGNGLDFLAMHRNMILALRCYFPRYDGLWRGWNVVPLNPDTPPDPTDEMPRGNSMARPFDPDRLKALDRLARCLGDFADDDEFGLYVETRNRPVPGHPKHTSSDRSTGIHNYLHARFSVAVNGCDPDQSVSMANFIGNIKNQRFWRLHGWIDNQWSRFRKLKGLGDDDPRYQAELREQAAPLDDMPEMCIRESPGHIQRFEEELE